MQDDLKIDSYFSRMLSRPPQAIAQLAGDVSHPNLSGTVREEASFYLLILPDFLPKTLLVRTEFSVCTFMKKRTVPAMSSILLPTWGAITILPDASIQITLGIFLH